MFDILGEGYSGSGDSAAEAAHLEFVKRKNAEKKARRDAYTAANPGKPERDPNFVREERVRIEEEHRQWVALRVQRDRERARKVKESEAKVLDEARAHAHPASVTAAAFTTWLEKKDAEKRRRERASRLIEAKYHFAGSVGTTCRMTSRPKSAPLLLSSEMRLLSGGSRSQGHLSSSARSDAFAGSGVEQRPVSAASAFGSVSALRSRQRSRRMIEKKYLTTPASNGETDLPRIPFTFEL